MRAALYKLQDLLLGSNDDEEEDFDDEYEDDEEEFIEPAPAKSRRRESRETREPVRRSESYARENQIRERETHARSERSENPPPRYDNVTRLHPETTRYEIILTKPKSIDDAPEVVNNLRANNVCVVSLEGIEKDKAQRIADFLGGSAYAFGGSIERISNDIFIITPSGVTVSGKIKNELKTENTIFPWILGR